VSAPDVVVVGGGIVGCSLAALLAEAGAAVRLYEREALAAGASGRNSGVLQHPMDEPLVPVHETSLELYRGLEGFDLSEDPVGVLVVSDTGAALVRDRAELAVRFPELSPAYLEPGEVRALEPALAEGVHAYRLDTGRPVPPAAATTAWAARARAAGADLRVGVAVDAIVADGVAIAGVTDPAGAVVVAAGAWTADLIGRVVAPMWGVIVEARVAGAPRHVVEQAGVEALAAGSGPDSIFSIVTADGVSAIGSTFLPERPDPERLAPVLLRRGERFLPALADVREYRARACPRPQSLDGRPLLDAIRENVYVATGHGPWGISLGPGSARLVAGAILGADPIPPALAASRFGW
jgi:glycine/D-amino acid oxidase-like deaminating enzyme